jgi:hypothetical protein
VSPACRAFDPHPGIEASVLVASNGRSRHLIMQRLILNFYGAGCTLYRKAPLRYGVAYFYPVALSLLVDLYDLVAGVVDVAPLRVRLAVSSSSTLLLCAISASSAPTCFTLAPLLSRGRLVLGVCAGPTFSIWIGSLLPFNWGNPGLQSRPGACRSYWLISHPSHRHLGSRGNTMTSKTLFWGTFCCFAESSVFSQTDAASASRCSFCR